MLEKLKQKLGKNETKWEELEITIEVNPGTADLKKLKMYYELGFIFPCLITLKGFDFLSHEVLSPTILYGYANWLFSFGMVIVTSSILYYKEKIVCKRK